MLQNSSDFCLMNIKVIDTGTGIDLEKQKMLFRPFVELMQKQNLSLVQNMSIGLGLACSAEIIKKLRGDIQLEQSQRGLTVFSIKMPVKTRRINALSSENPVQETEVAMNQLLHQK